MSRFSSIFCCLLTVTFMFSCSALFAPESVKDLSNVKGYQIDRVQFNYFGSGRVLIKKGSIHYSGSFELSLSKDRKMQLKISHLLRGTIVTIFMDGSMLQVLNQYDREYYQKLNNSNRKSNNPMLMDMDVSVWQSIFWGRSQKLETGKVEYLFKQNRPDGIVVQLKNQHIIVSYTKWMNLHGIQIPKVIKIKDDQNNSSVKFVLLKVTAPKEQELEKLVPPEDFLIKNQPFFLDLEKTY